MRFISHLDTMRLFKRVFKRAGIEPAYSRGFNPHPKMSFAQPLALGYEGLAEYMEFETEEPVCAEDVKKKTEKLMPEGIGIIRCIEASELKKTMASAAVAAGYIIVLPALEGSCKSGDELWHMYMGQEKIMAEKYVKKKNREECVDIKPMIRDIKFFAGKGDIRAEALLYCGSRSNLSPELVIQTVERAFDLEIPRSDVEVTRKIILFSEETQKVLNR